ncbi:hypothetical protein BaRGS_00010474, partial [Batillaria attramentaria]
VITDGVINKRWVSPAALEAVTAREVSPACVGPITHVSVKRQELHQALNQTSCTDLSSSDGIRHRSGVSGLGHEQGWASPFGNKRDSETHNPNEQAVRV